VEQRPPDDGEPTEALGGGAGPRRALDDSPPRMVSPPAGQLADPELGGLRLGVGDVLLDRFRVLRFIARGGMGAVYEASDSLLKTRVALKLLRRPSSGSAELERFRREVLLARRVGHPNVCRVYELYEGTSVPGAAPILFLTMELLEGESLAQRLAGRGRLTTVEAAPLVRQMCEGLAAAHAEGVIHRDFKSSNVMLVPRTAEAGAGSTRVVITDFGVARAVRLASEEIDAEPLTGRAGILGTPEYMAPEQVTGGEVTAATDIYALGVVLYEMVTGKLPFAGDTPLAAAARRLDEAPPRPDASVPGLDGRWVDAILHCLARQPERRFRSARDVGTALERRARRPRPLLAASSVLLVLAVVGAFLAWRRYHPGASEPRGVAASLALPARAILAPRPTVAVLGFKNELPSAQPRWLPTATAELVGHEIAAARSSVRLIGSDRVAKARRSLGITDDQVVEERSRQRMEALLASDLLVLGSLTAEPSSPEVTLHVELHDARHGESLARFEALLGPEGALLAERIPDVGARLRGALGIGLSREEEGALSGSRVRNGGAARPYAEGIIRLRQFEFTDARNFFEAVLTADPGFLPAGRLIAETWGRQGERKRAQEALERVRSQTAGLTAHDAAELDARILRYAGQGERAGKVEQALLEAFPDDVGLFIGSPMPPRRALAFIQRLRQLYGTTPVEPGLDLHEAMALGSTGEAERAHQLLEKLAARARDLGARIDLAEALRAEGQLLHDQGHGDEARAPWLQAEELFAQAGDVERYAFTRRSTAALLTDLDPSPESINALRDTAGLFRRLGHRKAVANTLIMAMDDTAHVLSVDLARRMYQEARVELDALEETSASDSLTVARATLAQMGADVPELETAIRELRETVPQTAIRWEGTLLWIQDRLPEARASLSRAETLWEQAGDPRRAYIVRIYRCQVDCDPGGRPADGVECLRLPSPPALGPSIKAGMAAVEASCLLASHDPVGAERMARESLSKARWREDRVKSTVVMMRIAAGRGETAKAISGLKALLAEVESAQDKGLAFDVRFALGEVELQAGRPEGRPRLQRLEQEASSRQFFRIARVSREALERRPSPGGLAAGH
jgi:eukaryotic-like serine/threonine-protein kinase